MNLKKKIKIGLFIVLLILLIAYIYYQSKTLIKGPEIDIIEPLNYSSVSEEVINIKGVANNIINLELNDRKIFIDENNQFNQKLLLHLGYNIIEIEGADKFGKKVIKTLELIYSPNID
jgi:hypothetical protein